MSIVKKHDLILVPTSKAQDALLVRNGRIDLIPGYLTQLYIASLNLCSAYSAYLYVVSDDEILPNDWYINFQHKLYLGRSGATRFPGLYDGCKKVIASNDPCICLPKSVLRLSDGCPFILDETGKYRAHDENGYEVLDNYQTVNYNMCNSLPPAFVAKFITEYNKSNGLDYCFITYDSVGKMLSGGVETSIIDIPQLDNEGNICVVFAKTSFTRAEVLQALDEFNKLYGSVTCIPKDFIDNNL